MYSNTMYRSPFANVNPFNADSSSFVWALFSAAVLLLLLLLLLLLVVVVVVVVAVVVVMVVVGLAKPISAVPEPEPDPTENFEETISRRGTRF